MERMGINCGSHSKNSKLTRSRGERKSETLNRCNENKKNNLRDRKLWESEKYSGSKSLISGLNSARITETASVFHGGIDCSFVFVLVEGTLIEGVQMS